MIFLAISYIPIFPLLHTYSHNGALLPRQGLLLDTRMYFLHNRLGYPLFIIFFYSTREPYMAPFSYKAILRAWIFNNTPHYAAQ